MMQKRHYEHIARWAKYQPVEIRESLTQFLRENNSNFKELVFRKAVWLEE